MTASLATLKKICTDYHKRIEELERSKLDVEYEVDRKDLEVSPKEKKKTKKSSHYTDNNLIINITQSFSLFFTFFCCRSLYAKPENLPDNY